MSSCRYMAVLLWEHCVPEEGYYTGKQNMKVFGYSRKNRPEEGLDEQR